MLAPGGTVIYCVCTPLPAEGIDIVEAALADGRVQRETITVTDVPGFSHAITASGDLLTCPGGESDHDIFFISRLKKT